MKRIINGMFYFLKFLLFLAAFGVSLFILFRMYQRLEKNMVDMIKVFIPYIVLFVLFIINIFARQKGVVKNTFYNVTCCIVFATILVIGYRTLFDTNMVFRMKTTYETNFNFYSDSITFINVMLYGLCIANFFLMFQMKEKTQFEKIREENIKKVEQPVAVQIETL